ncbi:hypothetical protein Ctob_009947 [Chrysochromulina tobinii]|uniref:Uncharacterized protein n=1 Tax=Chrysochromulina tobinii TaxID=1460289 RepID=A0A0M0K3L6_9EUKA|nr:hypothetical protein Ctob_009947 [Chrysochromulina tobinii]|eukprot:KOO33409.1 hypothetical protein Ctob_009947 [Chrysochromulina sp. CCMP291]
MRTSVAQGGTTSFWAALMADALHGRSAHILVWEYAINDHSVSLEAAGRGASAAASLGPPTMRYMIDAWLRRSLSYRPPPLLMLTYLWDKQPAAPFKAGNRALCRHMPVPSSAYDAQRSVLEQYGRAGAGVAALNVAGYVSTRRRGRFCPLVADSYFHPSAEGHALVADLLSAVLLGLLRAPERGSSAAVDVTVDSSAAAADGATWAGSFLAQSWGYLQQWHVLDGAAPREWRLCNEPVPNARCVGWRCGLEFKMPMKTPSALRPLARGLSSASEKLAMRMEQELQQLFGSTASKSRSKAAAPPPLPAAAAASSRRAAKSLLRRMPEHMLPPYIEANFRLMTFVLTRAPKMSDFPRERLYRPESIDLLFRHYYMSKRA